MPTAFADRRVTILRQRLRGITPDPLLARRRLESLLAGTDLHPSGLPPSAILCVRALRDPLPGTLRLNGYASRLPQHWEQALTNSLDDCVRHAVRPLCQVVPANADAVIFEDRAELLACLALDWASGLLGQRWWWRSLLSDYDVNRTVWSLWLETPQYVPSALAHLAARGEVVRVVDHIDEAIVNGLMTGILEAFNLRNLATVIQASLAGRIPVLFTASASSGSEWASEVKHAESDETTAKFPRTSALSTYGFDRVPESQDVRLALPRRLLLGVALSLMRDLVRARSLSFALETQRWLQNAAAEVKETLPTPAKRPAPVAEVVRRDEMPHDDETTPFPAADEHAALEPQAADAVTLTEGEVRLSDTPASSVEARLPVETAYGGLFYLLNLALHLGFYADFASPWKQEIELSMWDFVALVGAELLGSTPSDPIWDLLAQLAGRAAETPLGASFVPPDVWHVDAQWLDAFPEQGEVGWSADGDRLRVLHPAGFLLADILLEGNLSSLLEAVHTTYGVDLEINKTNNCSRSSDDALRRWLDWLIPYVRARLRRALGLGPDDNPASLLCQHRARIYVTPAQVDVLLNLDTLPIEIRLAGLDRNPGWLPAAGRTITFHFEPGGSK